MHQIPSSDVAVHLFKLECIAIHSVAPLSFQLNHTNHSRPSVLSFVERLTTYNHGKWNFNDVLRSDRRFDSV